VSVISFCCLLSIKSLKIKIIPNRLIIKVGGDSISENAFMYLSGFWLTELKTTPASLVFIEIILDKNDWKLIIENGLDIEKNKTIPNKNNIVSLYFFLYNKQKRMIGRDIKAVILVPTANPNSIEDRIR